MARPRCEAMSPRGYQCERRAHKPTTLHVAHTYTGSGFRWDDETPEADAPENERGTSNMTEAEVIELESYKHHNDTEQDRIRVGDKVVRRFGHPGAPRNVIRIWRKGPRGRIRFTFDLSADGDAYAVSMYANRFQRKGDQ